MSNAATATLKSIATDHHIDTGVKQRDRKALANKLAEALSDSYLLYLQTQNVHWNVVGPLFYSIHEMTEKQYLDMAEAIDDIAERIRAIGFRAPGTVSEFLKLTEMTEDATTTEANQMIEMLVRGNELCAKRLRKAVIEAERVDDVKTADLLTERIGQHEENAWMLRSLNA
ncbi:MAG: DNA starvation/stationary phase protection protein [Gammaproteobacteria bacterium]|nr:DNA starvation/stationary phase protection protein [Gammaproteobacteria bacterium]NVK87186.1 DNA starvation/stationary phase protection protein [Gammaproteobacteria bacterium]